MRGTCAMLLLVAVTGAGLASCASSRDNRRPLAGPLPLPSPDAAVAAGLNAERAQEAHKLYDAKCLRCHKSYDPHAYSGPQWDVWMTKMTRKAHLEPGQRDLLLRYLGAVRSTPVVEKE